MMAPKNTGKTFRLNTGAEIPAIGLGTWKTGRSSVRGAVATALRTGYRHIDTALAYENEAEVGAGLSDSGVPRDQVWITTKLDNSWHKRAAEGLDASLENLGVEYVDLYLMHWPVNSDPDDSTKPLDPNWDFVQTWKEMEKLDRSKARAIGVSNFQIRHLERLLSECTIVPAVNQIELHPFWPSPELVSFCHSPEDPKRRIQCIGYACLGAVNSPLHTHDVVTSIAREKGKMPAQVLIMWGMQKGWSVIPKSTNKERIEANFALDGWELSEEEMKEVDGIKEREKYYGDDWLPQRVFLESDGL